MNDFFALLSQRALQPAAIHPRLPSRFESDSAVPALPAQDIPAEAPLGASQPVPATMASLLAAPTVAPLAASAPTPIPLAESVVPVSPVLPLPHIAAEPRPLPQLAEPALPHVPARPLALEAPGNPAPRVIAPQPAVQVSARIASEPPAPVLQVQHERLEHHELSREVIEQRVERLRVEGVPALPSPAAALSPAPAQALRDVPGAPAPRVEISIGRIEVLPLEPAAAPHREAPAKPAPAQSLDAYLQERSAAEPGRGGRR
ncbi:hypothetical protein IB229_03525 [Pseudomonas sp. PDM14]|uniref:hypothetical protein n=1 Tax=Pseudomonas sp. PDM14 TaxID=2769288 RepID=UPI0017827C8D|nr:hypothetical protein [Pseudomonas sp. PDM14]MBD9482028.1 hypothetical protein [Pseudomonas sp. PDM14]